MHTAVWKIGGSLFDLPGLAPRLTRMLSETAGQHVLLVPGGGPAADVVRAWQRCTKIDDDIAHWLAIGALDFNARLLSAACPHTDAITTPAEATHCWQRHRIPVLSPTTWLQHAEHEQNGLPHHWGVTSDSIAAWIAARWSFQQLVLFKSRALDGNTSVESAAARGLVDAHFPQVARDVPRIAWCNLREESPQIVPWVTR